MHTEVGVLWNVMKQSVNLQGRNHSRQAGSVVEFRRVAGWENIKGQAVQAEGEA